MEKSEENRVKKCLDYLLSSNVNSACWTMFYQPKLPAGIKRFKKK